MGQDLRATCGILLEFPEGEPSALPEGVEFALYEKIICHYLPSLEGLY